MKSGSPRSGSAPGSDRVVPDHVVLVVGEEELLVERAVSAAVSAVGPGPAGQSAPGGPASDGSASEGAARGGAAVAVGAPDLHDVTAAALTAGELTTLTAPSLFGGGCVVVVRSAQDAGKEVAAELVRLAQAPPPDVTLIVAHSGGGRTKSLVASLVSAGAWRVDCPVIKRFGDRMDFLRGWTAAGLAAAHAAAAEADAQVKGEAASAGYALERAITTIVACRAQG